MKHLHSHSVVFYSFITFIIRKSTIELYSGNCIFCFFSCISALSTRGSGAPFPVAWKDLSVHISGTLRIYENLKPLLNFSDFMCSKKLLRGCRLHHLRRTSNKIRMEAFGFSSSFSHLICTDLLYFLPQLAPLLKCAAVSDKDGEICRAWASKVMQKVKGRCGK